MKFKAQAGKHEFYFKHCKSRLATELNNFQMTVMHLMKCFMMSRNTCVHRLVYLKWEMDGIVKLLQETPRRFATASHSPIHHHIHIHQWVVAAMQGAIKVYPQWEQLEFSVLPKDTSACGQQEPVFKLRTLQPQLTACTLPLPHVHPANTAWVATWMLWPLGKWKIPDGEKPSFHKCCSKSQSFSYQ